MKFLIDPFNILWLLGLATILAWWLKKERLCRWLIITAGIWFLIISTPLIPTVVLNSLETRYQPIYLNELSQPEAEYHIIILGGGHGFDDRLPANSLLSKNALARLNEGIRLHRKLPNSMLILSGSTSTPGKTTQAEMLQKAAMLLGIEEKATLLQKEPGNTFQEAKIYAKKFGNSHPVIIVTGAAHMPRAVLAFRENGIKSLASPTNYRLKGSWKHKWFGWPSMDNIENLQTGIYEYVGILWYSIKG